MSAPNPPIPSQDLSIPPSEASKASETPPSTKVKKPRKKQIVKLMAFPKFNKLPIEIQRMIWRFANKHPRVIRARWRMSKVTYTKDSHIPVYLLFGGPVPPLLQVNRAARGLLENQYTRVRCAASVSPEGRYYENKYDTIYINFELDTIYFVNINTPANCLSWMRFALSTCTIPQVAFSAFIASKMLCQSYNINFFFTLLQQNPTLKAILFVLDNSTFEKDSEPSKYIFQPFDKPPQWRGGKRQQNMTTRSKLRVTVEGIERNNWQAPLAGFAGSTQVSPIAAAKAAVRAAEWHAFWISKGGKNAFVGPQFQNVIITRDVSRRVKYI